MNKSAAAIEAILFTAHEPISPSRLGALLELTPEQVEETLAQLEQELQRSGLRLSRHDDGLRLVTAPEYSKVVEQALASSGRAELTKPALETLSIIAYRGPINRTNIEAIRGVNSEAILRNLLGRDLIRASGQPPVYTVSTEFLDHFGLTATSELPPIDTASGDNLDPA